MSALLRHVLGWGCLALGVAGLVLPILQGWLFIALGAVLLAPDVPVFERLLCWVRRRFPRLRGAIDRMRARLHPARPRPRCPEDE